MTLKTPFKKTNNGTDSADGKLVSALVRGISVLGCFSNAGHELSMRELMERTGLPKPTLFRLVETLCELELLRYSERLSKYVPGLGLLALSSPVLARLGLRQLARAQMQELAELCQGQVQLAVGHRYQLCLVELAHGMGQNVWRPELGVQMSLSRTATGRAYLLQLPEAQRQAHIQALRQQDAERADWLQERLQAARADFERHGFCRSHGDLTPEIESIAMPMSQAVDGEHWVFAVSLPTFSPMYERLETDLGPRLRALVRSVEGALGGGGALA